jgi:hypothetical protein
MNITNILPLGIAHAIAMNKPRAAPLAPTPPVSLGTRFIFQI